MGKRHRKKKAQKLNRFHVIFLSVPLGIAYIFYKFVPIPWLGIICTAILAILAYLGGGGLDQVYKILNIKNKPSKYVFISIIIGVLACILLISFDEWPRPTRLDRANEFTKGLTEGLLKELDYDLPKIDPKQVRVNLIDNYLSIELAIQGIDTGSPLVEVKEIQGSLLEELQLVPSIELFLEEEQGVSIILNDMAFFYGGFPDTETDNENSQFSYLAEKMQFGLPVLDAPSNQRGFLNFIKVNQTYAYRNCAFIKVLQGKITYFDPKDWLYLMYYKSDDDLNYFYGEKVALEIRALDAVLDGLQNFDEEEANQEQFLMVWEGFHHWVAYNGIKERRIDIWPSEVLGTVIAEETLTPEP